MSVPIPRLSGGLPLFGHLFEMRRNPLALMQRCRDECGEMGELRLASQSLVMLYGEAAQEAFFRAPDEQLDQAAAYPFMKPSVWCSATTSHVSFPAGTRVPNLRRGISLSARISSSCSTWARPTFMSTTWPRVSSMRTMRRLALQRRPQAQAFS